MHLITSLCTSAGKLAIGAIDSWEFKRQVGMSPDEALYYSAIEVGECAELFLKGELGENSDRYVRARETAISLATYVKGRGAASFYVKETIKGTFSFVLYSFKRKFVPGTVDFPEFTDYGYYNRIKEFLEYVMKHNHQELKNYAMGPGIGKR